MKQFLLALTAVSALAFGGSAQAQVTPSGTSSIFDQLSALFQTGTQPENADLIGWRSGRCYHAETPSNPENSMLAGWTVSGPDQGPIAPHDEILSTLPVHWQNGAAGSFDSLTPEIEQSVGNFIDQQKPSIAPASIEDGSVWGSYFRSPGTPWIIRKTPDYVVAEMMQNGYVSQMCYYFKLVRP